MITATKTAEMLAAQFTENTGTHILDSGGGSGRGWQRRAGMTADDFLALPEIEIDDDMVSVNTFHLLAKHLHYSDRSADLTAQFRAYVDSTAVGDAYTNSCYSVQEWLDTIGGEYSEMENTYNYETLLDNTLQYVSFWLGGNYYTALSTHNGADVRGGYSDIVIYDGCDDWLWQATQADIHCRMCNRDMTIEGYNYVLVDGVPYDGTIGRNGECPVCRWPELVGGMIGGCCG